MEEIWKEIPGYEGIYEINNFGKVKNKKRNHIMNWTLTKEGYYITRLSKKGKKKNYFIHRLVAIAFLPIENFKLLEDENKNDFCKNNLTVNHKYENKLNNNVENLEWCTNRYNVKYSSNKKKKPYKKRKPYKRKTRKQLFEYMKERNIDEGTIKIIKDFFKI